MESNPKGNEGIQSVGQGSKRPPPSTQAKAEHLNQILSSLPLSKTAVKVETDDSGLSSLQSVGSGKQVFVLRGAQTVPGNSFLGSSDSGPITNLLKKVQARSLETDKKAIAEKLQTFISEQKSIVENSKTGSNIDKVSSPRKEASTGQKHGLDNVRALSTEPRIFISEQSIEETSSKASKFDVALASKIRALSGKVSDSGPITNLLKKVQARSLETDKKAIAEKLQTFISEQKSIVENSTMVSNIDRASSSQNGALSGQKHGPDNVGILSTRPGTNQDVDCVIQNISSQPQNKNVYNSSVGNSTQLLAVLKQRIKDRNGELSPSKAVPRPEKETAVTMSSPHSQSPKGLGSPPVSLLPTNVNTNEVQVKAKLGVGMVQPNTSKPASTMLTSRANPANSSPQHFNKPPKSSVSVNGNATSSGGKQSLCLGAFLVVPHGQTVKNVDEIINKLQKASPVVVSSTLSSIPKAAAGTSSQLIAQTISTNSSTPSKTSTTSKEGPVHYLVANPGSQHRFVAVPGSSLNLKEGSVPASGFILQGQRFLLPKPFLAQNQVIQSETGTRKLPLPKLDKQSQGSTTELSQSTTTPTRIVTQALGTGTYVVSSASIAPLGQHLSLSGALTSLSNSAQLKPVGHVQSHGRPAQSSVSLGPALNVTPVSKDSVSSSSILKTVLDSVEKAAKFRAAALTKTSSVGSKQVVSSSSTGKHPTGWITVSSCSAKPHISSKSSTISSLPSPKHHILSLLAPKPNIISSLPQTSESSSLPAGESMSTLPSAKKSPNTVPSGSKSVYSTCVRTAQGSVPVMVVTPSLDEDTDSETELGDEADEDTKWAHSLMQKDLNPIETVQHTLPRVPSQSVEQLKKATPPSLLSEAPNPADSLGIRIESVFSLTSSEEPVIEDDIAASGSQEESFDATELATEDCSTPVKTFNIAESNAWRRECTPCYTVLERLSKSELFENSSSRSICSQHCRNRHVDNLCALGLLPPHDSTPKAVKRDLTKPTRDESQSMTSHTEPVKEKSPPVPTQTDSKKNEPPVRTVDDDNDDVQIVSVEPSTKPPKAMPVFLGLMNTNSIFTKGAHQNVKYRLYPSSNQPIKFSLTTGTGQSQKLYSVVANGNSAGQSVLNGVRKSTAQNLSEGKCDNDGSGRRPNASTDVKKDNAKQGLVNQGSPSLKGTASVTSLTTSTSSPVSSQDTSVPVSPLNATLSESSTAVSSPEKPTRNQKDSSPNAINSMDDMKGFSQRLSFLAHQVSEKRHQMQKAKERRKHPFQQSSKRRKKLKQAANTVMKADSNVTTNSPTAKLRSLLPDSLRNKPEAMATSPSSLSAPKMRFQMESSKLAGMDPATGIKLKSALDSLAKYVTQSGMSLTQRGETRFLIKVGEKHFLVKLPGQTGSDSEGTITAISSPSQSTPSPNTQTETALDKSKVAVSQPTEQRKLAAGSQIKKGDSIPLPVTTSAQLTVKTSGAPSASPSRPTQASPLLGLSGSVIERPSADLAQSQRVRIQPATSAPTLSSLLSKPAMSVSVSKTKCSSKVPEATKQNPQSSMLIQVPHLVDTAKENASRRRHRKEYADPNSALSHLPPNKELLPERKRPKDTDTEETRLMKRQKLEEKYPLPPGIIIKSEPVDFEDLSPQAGQTAEVGLEMDLAEEEISQNVQPIEGGLDTYEMALAEAAKNSKKKRPSQTVQPIKGGCDTYEMALAEAAKKTLSSQTVKPIKDMALDKAAKKKLSSKTVQPIEGGCDTYEMALAEAAKKKLSSQRVQPIEDPNFDLDTFSMPAAQDFSQTVQPIQGGIDTYALTMEAEARARQERLSSSFTTSDPWMVSGSVIQEITSQLLAEDDNDEPPPLIEVQGPAKSRSKRKTRRGKSKLTPPTIADPEDDAPPLLEPMVPSASSSATSCISQCEENDLMDFMAVSENSSSVGTVVSDQDTESPVDTVVAPSRPSRPRREVRSTSKPDPSRLLMSKPVSAQSLRIQRLKALLKKKEREYETMRKMRSQLPVLDLDRV